MDLVGLQSHHVLWPDHQRGPWVILGHWTLVDERPECVGIEVWKGAIPEPHTVATCEPLRRGKPAPIVGTDLRELPVASIISALWEAQRATISAQQAHAKATLDDSDSTDEVGMATREFWRLVAEEASSSPFSGEPHRLDDPAWLAGVADVYRRAHANRRPPTRAVADHYMVSHSTATKWIARARQKGVLGPARHGVAGEVRPSRRRRGKSS